MLLLNVFYQVSNMGISATSNYYWFQISSFFVCVPNMHVFVFCFSFKYSWNRNINLYIHIPRTCINFYCYMYFIRFLTWVYQLITIIGSKSALHLCVPNMHVFVFCFSFECSWNRIIWLRMSYDKQLITVKLSICQEFIALVVTVLCLRNKICLFSFNHLDHYNLYAWF